MHCPPADRRALREFLLSSASVKCSSDEDTMAFLQLYHKYGVFLGMDPRHGV